MKEILYMILVIFLTPIYMIVKIFSTFIKWMLEIAEPMGEAIGEYINNMQEFWNKIFIKKRINKKQ